MSDSGNFVTVLQGTSLPTPDTFHTLIGERFDQAFDKADQMMNLLVGEDGESGYLYDLKSAILSAPDVSIIPPSVNTDITLKSATSDIPAFDVDNLQSYPEETYITPSLTTLPGIDTSSLRNISKPATPDASFVWSESAIPVDLYTSLLARILNDLQNGATGLDADVEAAIYARARARLQSENDALYQKLNNEWMQKRFSLPSGSLAANLADFYAMLARQVQSTNNDILVAQGDLAQKNSQFIIQQSVALEQLIRQTTSDQANRALEYRKSKATLIIQTYSEMIRAYVADLEGQKTYIESQVEVLKGVIESNRAKVDIYREQYAALKVRTEAVTAHNTGLVDVFRGEMQGYESEERGVASANQSRIELIRAKVAAAEIDVRAAIASAEQLVAGFTTESSIKEKVSSDLAHIAAQAVASWASSVSSGVNMGYSSGESKSEQWSHSASLHEAHSYEHDPLT